MRPILTPDGRLGIADRKGGEASVALDRKPAHGAPCNSCGLCCMATVCPLGQHVLGVREIGSCPALTKKDDGTYGCGLALDPARYAGKARALSVGIETLRRAALFLIGSGDGCDARFNGEPRNASYAEALDAKWRSRESARRSAEAKRIWGARP